MHGLPPKRGDPQEGRPDVLVIRAASANVRGVARSLVGLPVQEVYPRVSPPTPRWRRR